jgi:hypothetical protein
MSDEDFRAKIEGSLTCRLDKREGCEDKMRAFLNR